MEEEVNYMQQFMKVQTSDNEIFEVSSQLCNFCKHFQQVLQDAAISEIIQIQIPSNIFKKIIDYFEYYKFKSIKLNLPKPLPQGDLSKFLNKFDYNFIYGLSDDELYNLIEAANNLNCEELLSLGCARLASIFKDRTFDEVKEKFGIEAELNQELKDEFFKDYDYLF